VDVGTAKGADIYFIGDSILKGYNADAIENRAIDRLAFFSKKSIQYIGGAGNNIADLVATAAQTKIAVAGKIVFLHIGTNDLAQGRTDAQVDTDLAAHVADLQTVGATVYVISLLPRGSLDVTPTNTLLRTRYGANYVDINSTLRASTGTSGIPSLFDTQASATLLHPNNSAQVIIADALAAHFPNLFYDRQSPFLGVASSFSQTINQNGLTEFKANNNSTGVSAAAGYTANSDGTTTGGFYCYPSTYSIASLRSRIGIGNNNAGIALAAWGATGVIDFLTGSTFLRKGGFSSAGDFDVTRSLDNGVGTIGQVSIKAVNTATGVNSQAAIQALAGTNDASFVAYSATDPVFPNMAGWGNGNNGLNIIAYGANGRVTFGTGGTAPANIRGNISNVGNWRIGDNTVANASAILDIASTTKGVLLPRMTKAQRDAIASPIAGLMIYQTDNTPGLRVHNGTNWMRYTETAD
jgi:hypothetical protein